MNKEFFNLVQQFQGLLPLIINDIDSCVNVSEQCQPELFPEENALKVFCEKYFTYIVKSSIYKSIKKLLLQRR